MTSARETFRKWITDRFLANHGSVVFVSAKNWILRYGCDHSEEAVTLAKDAWSDLCASIDIPFISEETEKQFETEIWAQIDRGIRGFIAQICVPQGETFAAKRPLTSPEVLAMANDPTLPA